MLQADRHRDQRGVVGDLLATGERWESTLETLAGGIVAYDDPTQLVESSWMKEHGENDAKYRRSLVVARLQCDDHDIVDQIDKLRSHLGHVQKTMAPLVKASLDGSSRAARISGYDAVVSEVDVHETLLAGLELIAHNRISSTRPTKSRSKIRQGLLVLWGKRNGSKINRR